MIKEQLFLGVDQGSSATKGVLLDRNGKLLEEWSSPVSEIERKGRQVEQDPRSLLDSVQAIFEQGVAAAKSDGRPLMAWGLSVQRSGVLAWRSETGEVLHPMITWADTRTQPAIDAFGTGKERIATQTGLPVVANFAAPKIHLLQRQFLDPKVYVATLDSYLVHLLSGLTTYTTESSMAARTMLYSLSDRGWSEWLCQQFQVDRKRLPAIAPSLSHHADYRGAPLMALLGDQQAALLGRYNSSRRALLNLGTIASLTVATGATIIQKPALKTSVLYSRGLGNAAGSEVQYLVENISAVSGTVLLEPLRRQWCHDSREMSQLCEDSYNHVPAGLAIAYWTHKDLVIDAWPTGVPDVMVCKPGATMQDKVRAVVENVGNLIVRLLDELAEKELLGERFPAEIDVAGGCSEVDYLMQYIADVSGHTLHKRASKEAGARGAALAAMYSLHPDCDLGKCNDESAVKVYRCQTPERRKRYQMWQRLEQDVINNRLPPHAEFSGN
jgi:glycerol kinase